MKANEFINEAKGKRIPILDKKTITILHRECGEFLSNATRPLYRGFRREINGLQKVPIRTNRRPADISAINTAAFNYLFEERTGIKDIRHITAYGSSELYTASEYGQVQCIFPTNGTHFLRARGISDVYSSFEHSKYDLEDVINDFIDSSTNDKMDNYEFEAVERKIVSRMHEVMNKIKSARGQLTVAQIDKLFEPYGKIWQKFIKQYQKVVSQFYLYDGFHPELSKAHEEIALFGKPYYYALASMGMAEQILKGVADQFFRKDYRLYLGNKVYKHEFYDDDEEIYEFIFNAIKNKQEIYLLKG